MEKPTKGSEFVFFHLHLLHYTCHKINPNCGRSYIHFPQWLNG